MRARPWLLALWLVAPSRLVAQTTELSPPARPQADPPKSTAAVLKEELAARGCADPLILCLDVDGRLLEGDKAPEVIADDVIIVRSIATICQVKAMGEGETIELTIDTRLSPDTLFGPSPPKKGETACVGDASAGVLKEKQFQVPNDVRLRTVIVRSARKIGETTVRGSERRHELHVDHGRYFVELGVLVPVVVNGSRRVGTSLIPGTAETMIAIDTDTHVTAALMLNVFPFGGRPRQALYTGFSWASLGLQGGIDLDFSDTTDQFYAGVLFEPITGLSLNAGLAVVKGEFLPEGIRPGMLVPAGAVSSVEKYMARGYVGVTFTTDILQTLLTGATAIKGMKLP